MHSYAGGEVALLIAGAVFLVLAIVCVIAAFVSRDADFVLGIVVFAFIAGIFAFSGVGAAHGRYDTLSDWQQLSQQGYVLVSVDLLEKQATVKTSDGCLITRAVVHSDRDGYELALDGRVIHPSDLTCAR